MGGRPGGPGMLPMRGELPHSFWLQLLAVTATMYFVASVPAEVINRWCVSPPPPPPPPPFPRPPCPRLSPPISRCIPSSRGLAASPSAGGGGWSCRSECSLPPLPTR